MLTSEWSAKLTVIHAFEPDVYALTRDPRPTPSWRQNPDLKRTIAIKQVHRDLGQLDGPFDLIINEGSPSDVILRAVNDQLGDIVVTGIARGETFGRFIFGGTVDQLVRTSTAPVLVVKTRARAPYRDIVVATDFSEASRQAIRATMAMFPDAKITMLHCYESTPSSMMRPGSGADAGHQLASGEYAQFISTDPLADAAIARLPILLERGSVDCIIQAYAADKNLDLVVIGSQGKNALQRMFFGSTAELMMASAPADVLVLPPPS
jgi:nucleotide-binding universal stress UspA family protein